MRLTNGGGARRTLARQKTKDQTEKAMGLRLRQIAAKLRNLAPAEIAKLKGDGEGDALAHQRRSQPKTKECRRGDIKLDDPSF